MLRGKNRITDDNLIFFRADAIIVGSGSGRATLARQLVCAGKRVLLLERGVDHRSRPYYGTCLGR